ncbi:MULTISPECIES: hypothetical protein [unclassified Rhodococcus (in: high G+C Gram-positive bacteria)]|uniref:hypothetical protein n=1 Tax=unclassified Rhodococcus (in: high G+C Gram-positive bacteria) TaxID=192944 RepID=UPI001639DC47|nr:MULTISPECIES: hypothetical protein [unclassified Rhodococcus (in: high G+C Gram-positive bacteria)]MBC2639666.1 hypothetical protein [Rhodococcus sp. 3A]MBC2895589.1 hypothetical protein [Rhodococcus sp. 4CII]
MTHDDIIRLSMRQDRFGEHYVAQLFNVGHSEVRAMLRELADAGHPVGTRRRKYSFGHLDAVCARIEQTGTVTASDLAKYFGVLPECLERGLSELTETGRIISAPDGYQISPTL